MKNPFALVSKKDWALAATIWYVCVVLFGSFVTFIDGSHPDLFECLILVPWRFITFPWRMGMDKYFDATLFLFAIVWHPIVLIPLVSLGIAYVKRLMKRKPIFREWITATGIWWIASGIIMLFYSLGDLGEYEYPLEMVITSITLAVSGPFFGSFMFFFGPDRGPSGLQFWFMSLVIHPFIWIPLIYLGRRYWKSRSMK